MENRGRRHHWIRSRQPGDGIARVFLNLQVEKRRVLQRGPILQLSER